MIRNIGALITMLCFTYSVTAQLTRPAIGGNKKASVSEQIGITQVTINYDRPAVKGREGKIWNTDIVHYGFKDLGFGTSKAAPWRAGANENTTITFSTDVKIEGQYLKAGSYGFFAAMGAGEATLIFSNNTSSWGSYYYDAKEDALRVNVKTAPLNESVERLKFEFMNQTDNSTTIALMWEKLKIPFIVEVDLIKTQMESFKNELRSNKGFKWENLIEASQFALQNNTHLEEALLWSDIASKNAFPGQKNFQTLSTKAAILNKLGKVAEADVIMKEAMPLATMQELHQYGRQLLQQKRNKEALDIFKFNAQKHPNQFTTLMGLTRGFSAVGDYSNALKNAQLALPLGPAQQKEGIEKMISTLKEGKDIN